MQKGKFQILLLIFTFAITASALAEMKNYTLDKAIEEAMKNNYDIKVAQMNVKKADAAVNEAFGNALPNVTFGTTYMRYLEPMSFLIPGSFIGKPQIPFVAMKMVQDNNLQMQGQVSQILFNSLVFKAIGSSKDYSDISREQLKSSFTKTVLDVKKAFYGALMAKEFVEIVKTSTQKAEENLSQAKAFFEEGFIPEYDIIRADIAVQNLKPMLINAQSAYSNALNGLKFLIGGDINNDIEVSGILNADTSEAMPDENKIMKSVLDNNFELKTVDMLKRLSQDMIDLRKSEFYPSVAVFSNYQYTMQSDDASLSNKLKTWTAGINFSISLFNGLQSNARLEQAQVDLINAEQRFKQASEGIKFKTKSALLQFNQTKEVLLAQERGVSQSEKGYEIALIRYKEGMGSQMEINDADIQLRQARLGRLQAIMNYLIAKAEIENLLSTLDTKYEK
ncbi:MAG: TolC family protein [Candidatus Kapabacteria bacterium]|nr:TolC family protein [Candidatus Kapabacteria bacterium]